MLSGLCVHVLRERRPLPKHQTSLEKIENIERKKDEAVLAREFTELGGEDQVLRALRTLLLGNED